MPEKTQTPVSKIIITLSESNEIEVSYTSNLDLNTRVNMLRDALQEELNTMALLLSKDSNGNLYA